MPLPSLTNMMRGTAGADPDADLESAEAIVTPEDYLDEEVAEAAPLAEDSLFENPVADDPAQYIEGEEPMTLGENMHGAGAELSDPLSGALPEGPEASMDQSQRDDMLDLLSQRAQARASRSEHFQAKAREMAGRYF